MTRLVLLLSLVSLLPCQAAAQAFCALRDPVRLVYQLFPEADAFSSIVREVDEDARDGVGDRLPFSLHNRELGQHTVYVVKRGDESLGVLHVRSERSRWGLVEIAWALDKDLRVRDFEFQRCRSRQRDAVEAPAFREQLRGRSIDEIRAYISDDGTQIRGGFTAPEGAEALAKAVLRSALKTIVATEVVWGAELAKVGIGAKPEPAASEAVPASPEPSSP